MLPHSAARWSPAAGGGPEPAETLAEQPRLTQLAQLVVRVGDVIYTLVGLETIVNESYNRYGIPPPTFKDFY